MLSRILQIVSVYLLLLFVSDSIYAQRQGRNLVDSLKIELTQLTDDTNKVDILNRLAFEYYSINPDSGIIYGKQALEISQNLGWEKGIASSYHNTAVNYFRLSNYNQALKYFLNALDINKSIGDKMQMARNLGNIGIIYSHQEKYEEAKTNYISIINIFKELNNKRGLAIAYGSLGNIFLYEKNYREAKNYFLNSLKLHEEINNLRGVITNLGNLGRIYSYLEVFDSALTYTLRAKELSEQIGDKDGIAVNLGNLGIFYKTISILSKEELKKIGMGITDKNSLLKKSIELSHEAVKLSKELGSISYLNQFYNTLAESYALLGDFEKAYDYSVLYAKLSDSLSKMSNKEKLELIEKQRELTIREKEIRIANLELENQKKLNYAFLGLIFFLILVAVLIYIGLRMNTKSKKIIAEEQRKSEVLLRNILPPPIAERLKAGTYPIADYHENASVVFIDIAEFTKMSSGMHPERIVGYLNDIFTKFDELCDKHGLEKIKTIGDCYLAASGIPYPNKKHAVAAAELALDAIDFTHEYKTKDGISITFRIGIDCGPIVAGVIGKNKFIYDLWGDTVNTASRMEDYGIIGEIQVSERFKNEIESSEGDISEKYRFEERGDIEMKGKGKMRTWLMKRIR